MKTANTQFSHRRAREGGQSITLVLLGTGLFLLGAIGLAVDVSNWWFHRQTAQAAADAACTAGIMDMMANLTTGGTVGGFPGGSPPGSFLCSQNTANAACQYAALNGYSAPGLTANTPGNEVFVSFPGSVPGVNVCGPNNPPPCIPAGTASPFLQVVVDDRVQTTFTGLLSGNRTTDVDGSAVCGILQSTAPVPIIVQNPTCPHAFELSGSSTVQIIGGPTRSVQVNSSNVTCAAATSGSANQCNSTGPSIDLSKGGPNFTGSEFAVYGDPKTAPGGFVPGTTGDWGTGAPISDPYALVSAPTLASLSPSPTDGAPHGAPIHVTSPDPIYGCPDTACSVYKPGIYTNPIVVNAETAIFVPGIYYMKPTTPDIEVSPNSPGAGCLTTPNGNQNRYSLSFLSNSVIRPASNTAPGSDGSNGVMFYLSGTGVGNYASVYFDSNSGKRTITAYSTSNATCPGGTPPPTQLGLPSSVQGNILVGPCTNKGTYIGPGSTDTSGTIRGLIFFQDRADADTKGQPHLQGGGGLVIAGNMYFHNCNTTGTGTGCLAPTGIPGTPPAGGYNAFLSLQGSPGSATYVLGNITTDELVMGGGGTISMSLNPNAVYNILKASLLE